MKRTRVLYALFTERTCNYGNESFTGDNTVRDKRLQLPSIMYFCVWNKRPCANIMERKWVFALGQINIGHLLSVSSNGFAFTIHSFLASFHKDLLHLINNCRTVENAFSRKKSEPSYLYRDIANYLGMLCVYLELHIEQKETWPCWYFRDWRGVLGSSAGKYEPTASESNFNFIRASVDKKNISEMR